MTREQGDRILALLDRGGPSQRDLKLRAESASNVLAGLAVLVAIVGGLGVIGGLVAMVTVDVVLGLVYVVAAATGAALYWGLLQVASVVAGYIAHRLR